VIMDMQVWPEITRWGYLETISASCLLCVLARPLTGRIKSRNHQTISEQRCGSGAITNIGSAAIKHSQIDHSDGKMVANARNGDEWGRDARIYRQLGTYGRHTARGRSGAAGPVLRTWGASVESGILTDNKLVSNGSSRLASGSGSGLESAESLLWTYQAAIEWQVASRAE
jgi:hypothetical protein